MWVRILKKINVFTVLLVLVSMSFVFRMSNLVIAPADQRADIGAISKAEAVEESHEQPPEMPKKSDGHAPTYDTAEHKETIKKTHKKPRTPNSLEMPRAFSTTEVEILQSLSKRRAELDKREMILSQRDALLQASEKQIDIKISELMQLKTEIKNLLDTQNNMQEKQLKSLVKIYETMKPKDAARIFDTLDMDILIAVLERMSERKTAPVFANMAVERAREVTIKLASQRQLPELPE